MTDASAPIPGRPAAPLTREVADLAGLPNYGYGIESPIFWGTLGYVVLEGTGFALAAATYLYLARTSPDWPGMAEPPGLLWSTLFVVLLVASLIPNHWTWARGEAEDLRGSRLGLVVMSAVGLVLVGLRFLEFGQIGVRWDTSAYGSIVWALLGLHTAHLVTDLGDTLVLTALMFTRHGRAKRFSDVADNAFYWDFVILAWVPLYLMIYLGPRIGTAAGSGP